MAFIVGNNLAKASTAGFVLPTFTTAGRPASPVAGQVIYNTTTQQLEIYANGTWQKAETFRGVSGFLTRQTITAGYIMGGYKNSSPWKNVNRLVHATDVCTNLGDLLTYAGAYTSGVSNLTRGFLWSTDNSFPGSSQTTSAFNMNTETTAGTNSNWNILVGRQDMATAFKETEFAYITGGGNVGMEVFNLTTETMSLGAKPSLTYGDTVSSDTLNGASAVSDENMAIIYGNVSTKLTFPTHTFVSTAAAGTLLQHDYDIRGTGLGGAHGQQKGINSKLGRGYAGNEGSYAAGYNLRRMVFATETYTTVSKPIGNSGEENFDMGQAQQYMYGMHDAGGQNNRGWKFVYATDTGAELGAGSVRTGVPGGSSGHCVWKA